MSETISCAYCQADIEPEDELVVFDGEDFCSDSCAEAWEEQNKYNEDD